jgi:hypothetical protein
LEEYQAVTSPTVKRRPFPAAGPAPPGDGVAPPLAVMASSRPGDLGEEGAGRWVGVAVELVLCWWVWSWALGTGGRRPREPAFMAAGRRQTPLSVVRTERRWILIISSIYTYDV